MTNGKCRTGGSPQMACRSLSRIHLRIVFRIQRVSVGRSSFSPARHYATHRDTPSSLLAQQLERASGSPNSLGGASGGDSVGPFPLGVQPLNLGATREKVTPWNELTPSGKGVLVCCYETSCASYTRDSSTHHCASHQFHRNTRRCRIIGSFGIRFSDRIICKKFTNSVV